MLRNGRLLSTGPVEGPLKSKGPGSLPALSGTCRRLLTGKIDSVSFLLRLLLGLFTDGQLALDVLDPVRLPRELDGLVDLGLALHVLARQIDHAVPRIDVD